MTAQIVKPRIRGFIATNAHPDGCAANVRRQVEAARAALPGSGLGAALVIGSSTGYGLASAIAACFGYGARTLGVCLERPAGEDRTGSAGWYNLAEAHRLARGQGRTLETINGDAFSAAVKQQAIDALRARFGPLDLLVYSLAAPRRVEGDTTWSSALKPIGAPYEGKAADLGKAEVTLLRLEPASEDEIAATVKVMGGEDWAAWVEALRAAGLLAPGFRTVAYSYVGPALTQGIYRFGTIGRAKQHLEATADALGATLRAACGGDAWVSINTAVVTQASAAIPAVPLYMSALFKELRARGLHEGTIEQIVRLFRDHLAPGRTPAVDGERRIRLDDREMRPEVQAAVAAVWERVDSTNLEALADFAAYQREFQQLFGFAVEGIDYDAPTEVQRALD